MSGLTACSSAGLRSRAMTPVSCRFIFHDSRIIIIILKIARKLDNINENINNLLTSPFFFFLSSGLEMGTADGGGPVAAEPRVHATSGAAGCRPGQPPG